jgi:hypothetical protein
LIEEEVTFGSFADSVFAKHGSFKIGSSSPFKKKGKTNDKFNNNPQQKPMQKICVKISS